MADAVLSQRLLIGGAALAALFLVVLALVGGFLLLAEFVDRYRQTDTKQAAFLAGTLPEPTPVTAVIDTTPGINLAARDECERIWSMPAHEPADLDLNAGCDRLRAAIRDQQQKEAGDA